MKSHACRICSTRTTDGVRLPFLGKARRPNGTTRVYRETRAVCPKCVRDIRDADTERGVLEVMAAVERKGAA